METRNYDFGGLTVQLWKHEVHGWFTTSPILAAGCGVTGQTIVNTLNKYRLVEQGLVFIENELGKNISLIGVRGPKPKQFWTVKGMQFAATLLRTEICMRFRNEVLSTIELIELQGMTSLKQVEARFEKMDSLIAFLLKESAEQRATIKELTAQLVRKGKFESSAASYEMHAAKAEKCLRESFLRH